MFEYKNKSWKNSLNQYFWKKLLAALALVLLVFATVSEVNVGASYFDRNHQSDYFNESSSVTPPTSQNNSGQISNEVRQRLTSEPTLPNQSTSVIEPLGSDACVEWYQIMSGHCIMRLVINVSGYITMIIFALIGALIDAGVFFAFQLIEFLLSANPTAQGSDAWFIAQQIYPILLNIALLLILFSFYYVGFQYLFGIKGGRVGWQEFLAKVVLAVILVNFSVFLVSIFVSFLHDIGSLFVNIYAQGGGGVGGAFQVAMKKAAGHSIDANDFFGTMGTLPNIFSPIGDFWMLVLVRIIYVAVGIFILMSLFRLVKIVLTRYVLLFLLLVIAPLGVVLFFSPIKALKEKGDQWLQTLWTQTILYPFFVITMAIGTVFIVNFANTAVPVDEMQYLDQTKLSSQLPRILALLVAFGVIQVIVNFFEKSFEGIASSTWTALKMGAVGGAATFLGSAWTTGSTVANMLKGGYRSFNAGKRALGGGVKGTIGGLFTGALGATVGAGIGVKKGLDKTANFAAGAASVVDLLGGEKVADKLANAPGILGKTFRAAQAQNKAFFANFTGLLAKKASFATTEWLRKAGFGDEALQLRRDIDIAIDMILPPNDYTGDSRGDLPGKGQGYQAAKTAGKLAKYRSYGYDPKLSSSQVLQRLNEIVTGNTPKELQEDYSKYPESVKEIAEEIIKRPEIISKLTPQQIEFFRANYERLIRDIPGWEEFVTNGGGVLLANEEKRKIVAKDDAAKGIEAVRQGKVSRRNFKDPVYLTEYVAYLRNNGTSRDLEELGKILDKDFSAFGKLNSDKIVEELRPYAEYLRDFGLPADVEKNIFRELAKMDDIGTLKTEDLQERVRDTSEKYLKNQFFKVNQIRDKIRQISGDASLRDKPVNELLDMLTQDNEAFKDFVDHLRSQNIQINNLGELEGATQDYKSFVDGLTTAYTDSERINDVTGKFQQTNTTYQSKRSDFEVTSMRTPPISTPAPSAAPSVEEKSGGGEAPSAGTTPSAPTPKQGKTDSLVDIVGPDGITPIRQYSSRQSSSSASVSNNVNNNNQSNNNNGGNTGLTGNSPSNPTNQGPQGPGPTSGSSSSNASPVPAPAAPTASGGEASAPSSAPSSTPSAGPTAPSASQPNVQVNIAGNLQELQKVKQELADYIRQVASSNLQTEIEKLNQQVEEAIQKVQAGIPKNINPQDLAAKITSITQAQYNIGNKVGKLGSQANIQHPEINPYIQTINDALVEINKYYTSQSSSNNSSN